MTDRGTPSSAARGPPSRRFSAWPHSGRPASPSAHTLHRSEPASSSTPHPFYFPHPPFASCLFFLLLKTPLTPPRQPADSSKSGSLQRASPAQNSLGPPCQNRDEAKKKNGPGNSPCTPKDTPKRARLRCNRTNLSTAEERREAGRGSDFSLFCLLLS